MFGAGADLSQDACTKRKVKFKLIESGRFLWANITPEHVKGYTFPKIVCTVKGGQYASHFSDVINEA